MAPDTPKRRAWFWWGLLCGCPFTLLGGCFAGLLLGSGLDWPSRAATFGLGAAMLGLAALAFALFRRWHATDWDIAVACMGFAVGVPLTLLAALLYVLSNEHGLRV